MAISCVKSLKIKISIGLLCIFLAMHGCAVKWTKAIQNGHIAQSNFNEQIDLEVLEGLIFTNVIIGGTNYRFLFDSGAPLSISKELQEKHSFKTVSKGNIVDSDHNRAKVKWVSVDKIQIGNVSFINQAAFVGDFKANPLLNCLDFDGIIGSNLMRQCNWIINQEDHQLTLQSKIDSSAISKSTVIPFNTDFQYNVFIDIVVDKVLLSNVRVDFGSNGSIALNKGIFTQLVERGAIDEVYLERGVQQTGMIGQAVELNRQITVTDAVRLNNLRLHDIELKSGKSDLIGNKVLSRFIVTIDWNNKNLYMRETKTNSETRKSPGFRIGFTQDNGLYIQSVIDNSIAFDMGMEPNMKVTKVDTLDFEQGDDFCDFVKHETSDTLFIELLNSKNQRQQYHIGKMPLRKD